MIGDVISLSIYILLMTTAIIIDDMADTCGTVIKVGNVSEVIYYICIYYNGIRRLEQEK